jgi:hypothetical protein
MKVIATLIVGLALMLPGSALAASSTCQSYSPQLCSVASNSATATKTTATTTTGTTTQSTLPFTGLDVVLLAVGGGSLLGAGLVVRRLSRNTN